jgi:hypothetical protein
VYRSSSPTSPQSARLVRELEEIWRTATADSIGTSLREARASVQAAPAEVQAEVAELMEALERLERWLRDG